jgi:hypothetical protein
MSLDLLLAAGMYVFVLFVALAFIFQRVRWRHRKRQGRDPGFHPTSTSLGNALHQLQSIAEPPAKYVITEMLDEEDEADDEDQGRTASPKTHLLRQAARIRRGECLERLTVLAGGKNVKDG